MSKTIFESLKAMTNYPVSSACIENIIEEQGLEPSEIIDKEIRNSREYKQARASMYLLLSESPNVSQGGITFSFSTQERLAFVNKAKSIFEEIGEKSPTDLICGYMGEDY